jgi:hypothetical protein
MLLLEQLYSYIVPNKVSIDKQGYVYYIRINLKDSSLYKIGYTSREVVDRLRDFRLIPPVTIDIVANIKLPLTEARRFEAILHTRHRNVYDSYTCSQLNLNPQPLHSGNTELYLTDVLGLDTGVYEVPSYVAKEKHIGHYLYCKCSKKFVAENLTEHAAYCPRAGLPISRVSK